MQINTVKDMKELILKIAKELEEGTITENEAKTLLLRLFGVIKPFVCEKHPNANTYTSTTGKICCVECFNVL